MSHRDLKSPNVLLSGAAGCQAWLKRSGARPQSGEAACSWLMLPACCITAASCITDVAH